MDATSHVLPICDSALTVRTREMSKRVTLGAAVGAEKKMKRHIIFVRFTAIVLVVLQCCPAAFAQGDTKKDMGESKQPGHLAINF